MIYKFKKVCSLFICIALIFTNISAIEYQAFAESIMNEKGISEEKHSKVENNLLLMDTNIEGDILTEKKVIINFNESIISGKNFNLIKLFKDIDNQEVTVTTETAIVVDEIPVILKVGIKDNMMSFEPEEEAFIYGNKYRIVIPSAAIVGKSSKAENEEIYIEFEYRCEDEAKEEIDVEKTTLTDNDTITDNYFRVKFNDKIEGCNGDNVQVIDLETSEVVEGGLMFTTVQNDKDWFVVYLNMEKIKRDKGYKLAIGENSFDFFEKVQNQPLEIEFNTYIDKDIEYEIVESSFYKEEGEWYFNHTSTLIFKLDKYIYGINPEKIKLYELVNDKYEKEIDIYSHKNKESLYIGVQEVLSELKKYKLVIESGSFKNPFEEEYDFSKEYDFKVKTAYPIQTMFKVNIEERIGETRTMFIGDVINIVDKEGAFKLYRVDYEGEELVDGGIISCLNNEKKELSELSFKLDLEKLRDYSRYVIKVDSETFQLLYGGDTIYKQEKECKIEFNTYEYPFEKDIWDEGVLVSDDLGEDRILKKQYIEMQFDDEVIEYDTNKIKIIDQSTELTVDCYTSVYVKHNSRWITELTLDTKKLERGKDYTVLFERGAFIFKEKKQLEPYNIDFKTQVKKEEEVQRLGGDFYLKNGTSTFNASSYLGVVFNETVQIVDPRKIKILEKVDGLYEKEVNTHSFFQYGKVGTFIYEVLSSAKDYKMIIQQGALKDLFGEDLDYSEEIFFKVETAYLIDSSFIISSNKEVGEIKLDFIGPVINVKEDLSLFEIYDVTDGEDKKIEEAMSECSNFTNEIRSLKLLIDASKLYKDREYELRIKTNTFDIMYHPKYIFPQDSEFKYRFSTKGLDIGELKKFAVEYEKSNMGEIFRDEKPNIVFNENIDAEKSNIDRIRIQEFSEEYELVDVSKDLYDVNVKKTGNIIELTLSEGIESYKEYMVNIPKDAVISEKGSVVEQDIATMFLRMEHLIVQEIDVSKVNDEQCIIELIFSTSITDEGIDKNFIKLHNIDKESVEVAEFIKEIRMNDNDFKRIQILINKEKLKDESKYELSIQPGALTGLAGEPIENEMSIEFYMGKSPKPGVIDVEPVMVSYPIDELEFIFEFDEQLKEIKDKSDEVLIWIQDEEKRIPCQYKLDNDGKRVRVYSKRYLEYDKEYYIKFKAGAFEDIEGNRSDEYNYRFVTDSYGGTNIETVSYESSTRDGGVREVRLAVEFDEKISLEGSDYNEKEVDVNGDISIFRISEKEFGKSLARIPVQKVKVNNQKIEVDFHDYLNVNGKYKVLFNFGYIHGENAGINTRPIIFEVEVKNIQKPVLLKDAESEKATRRNLYENDRLTLKFNEDVVVMDKEAFEIKVQWKDGEEFIDISSVDEYEVIANEIIFEYDYDLLPEEKRVRIFIEENMLGDKDGNLNDKISLEFDSYRNTKFNTNKVLEYTNSVIKVEFDSNIKSIGNIDEIESSMPLTKVVFSKNFLYIIPYTPTWDETELYLTYGADLKVLEESNVNYEVVDKELFDIYTETQNILIPYGFIRFEDENNIINREIEFSHEYAHEEVNDENGNKFYKLMQDKKRIEIMGDNNFNTRDLVRGSKIQLEADQTTEVYIDGEKVLHGISGELSFKEIGEKELVSIFKSDDGFVFEKKNINIIDKPNIEESVLSSEIINVFSLDREETSSIKVPMKLECEGIPLEGKRIFIDYEIISVDSKENSSEVVKLLEGIKKREISTDSYGKNEFIIEEILLQKIIEDANIKSILLIFETEELFNKDNVAGVRKNFEFKIERGNINALLQGKITFEFEDIEIDKNILKNSLQFFIEDKEYNAEYGKVKSEKNRVIIDYRIKDLAPKMNCRLVVKSKALGKDAVVNTEVDLNSEIITKNIKFNGSKDSINGFEIEKVWFDYRTQTVEEDEKLKKRESFVFIKGIKSTDTLFVKVNWGESDNGNIVLKRKGKHIQFDSTGKMIQDKESEILILKRKKKDEFSLKTDFSKIPLGVYEIAAVDELGRVLVSEINIRVVEELPNVLDSAAYYVTGDYAIGMQLDKGMTVKFPKISKKVPVIGGKEFVLDIGDIIGTAADNQKEKNKHKKDGKDSNLQKARDALGKFPLTSVFDNKEMEFRMSLGMNQNLYEKKDESEKKRNVQKAYGKNKSKKKTIEKTTKKVGTFSVDFKVSLDFVMRLEDDSWIYEGGVNVGASIGLSWEYHTIVPVWIIPIPVYFKAGVEVGVKGYVGFLVETDGKVIFTYAASIYISIEVAAGVGIKRIRGEVFAEVSLEGGIEKRSRQPQTFIEINSELGVRLIINLWLWKKTYKKSWKYKYRKNYKLKNIAGGFDSIEPYYLVKDEAKLMKRNITHQDKFISENTEVNVGKMSNEMSKDSGSGYTQQQVARIGDNRLMIGILDDDKSRETEDRNIIKYTIFDENGFTEFKPIDDDKTLDSNFVLERYNDSVVAVWSNFKKPLSDLKIENDMEVADDEQSMQEGEIKEYLQYGEVVVAIYNRNLDTWEKAVLSNDLESDDDPKIATNNEKILVIWTKNSGNEIIQSQLNKDQLYFSEFNGEEWSDGIEIKTDDIDGMILDYSPAVIGEKEYVVFTVDMDSNLESVGDKEIFIIEKENEYWGNPIRLTDDNSEDDLAEVVSVNGKVNIVWKKGNNLMMSNSIYNIADSEIAVEGYDSGEPFDLVYGENTSEIFISWGKTVPEFESVSGNDGTKVKLIKSNVMEVFAATYNCDVEKWGTVTQITDDKKFNRFVDTEVFNDKLKLIYSSVYIDFKKLMSEMHSDAEVIKINEDTEESNLYKENILGSVSHREQEFMSKKDIRKVELEELSQIKFGEFERNHDLELIDFVIPKLNPTPGEEIVIDVTVKNKGDYFKSGEVIEIYLEDDETSELVGSQILERVIAPGEELTESLTLRVPEYLSNKKLTVILNPNKVGEEISYENNKVSKEIIFESIDIESSRVENEGERYYVYEVIENKTVIPVIAIDTKIFGKNKNGDLEEVDDFKMIKGIDKPLLFGDSTEVIIEIDGKNSYKYDSYHLMLTPNEEGAYESTFIEVNIPRQTLNKTAHLFHRRSENLECFIKFNDFIKEEVNFEKINVRNSQGLIIESSKAIDGDTLLIRIEENQLKKNQVYTICIPSKAVKTKDDKYLDQEIVVEYLEQGVIVPEKRVYNTEIERRRIEVADNVKFYGQKLDENITIEFGEVINKGRRFSEIILQNYDGKVIDGKFEIIGNKLIIDPDENLTYSTRYKVSIPQGGIQDKIGIECYEQIFNLSSEFEITDEVLQLGEVRNVPVDKKWQIKFNRNLNEDIEEFGEYIKIIDSNNKEIEITIEMKENELLVYPKVEGFNPGETYILYIHKGLRDKTGIELNNDAIMKFTIEK